MGCLYHQHEILQCSFILLGGESTVRVKCLTQENNTMSPGQDIKAGPLDQETSALSMSHRASSL